MGVFMSSDCSFDHHISVISKKCSSIAGWILRTFTSRDRTPMSQPLLKKFSTPSEQISTPLEKISTPPEKIPTPPNPPPRKFLNPPEKFSTPPKISQLKKYDNRF